MGAFEEAYHSLNAAQKTAVDHIDGPLLVMAGPGTGKTQLLGVRVANILQKTDTPPRNILCLTFTENGASNMRERIGRFVGPQAYDITISTYHAFGGELIRRFPEYFTETRLQNPVDELGRREIVTTIVENMRYSNPLKQTRHHENDLINTLSEVKRALLSAEDLRLIATENVSYIHQVNHNLETVFNSFTRIPKLSLAIPLFEKVEEVLAMHTPLTSINTRFGSLAQAAILSLRTALDEARVLKKTTPLTSWKNDWLARSNENKLTFNGELASKRVEALADVLNQYQAALNERGLYDFDDMILRAIYVLEHNDGLRYTLQEQYLYLLLDEFQDTNAAQLQLVRLLTDSPVNEGRPNVMAVGDDDQAIYAFQGALYSNMLDFYQAYRDVRIVTLSDNYRSTSDIVATSGRVADQIEERLRTQFEGAHTALVSVNRKLAQGIIERREFLSDIAQADWVATQIKQLVAVGTHPSEIAILAPRHKQLEPLIPYLNAQGIPVRYEKRENILDAPVVKQLLSMSRLVLALHSHDEATANNLWPEVLSYEFWQHTTGSIWEIAWHVEEERYRAMRNGLTASPSWSRVLLADNIRFRIPALIFLTLAHKVSHETGEIMLDYLTGTATIDTNEVDLPSVYSPLRDYYTSANMRREHPELFYETVSHLAVLRARLREHQSTHEDTLSLKDLINFVDMYRAADERMINTSPYNQATDSIQVMTVFKAKGLEFGHVFLLSLQDEVWGSTSRSQSNRITLPTNLIPIRYAGVTDDERLRILYVAMTRAKLGLYLTSVTQSYSGKATKHLKYLLEHEVGDAIIDDVLPETAHAVKRDDSAPPSLELLELDWRQRHVAGLQHVDLKAMLEPRVAQYHISPTHLSSFLDLEYAGPERFFLSTILRFPEAPLVDGQFGNAIHETLEWVQHIVIQRGNVPDMNETLLYFTNRMRSKRLNEDQTALEIERGERALAAFLMARQHQYRPTDQAEVSFRNEGVTLGDIHLAGKVDRLEIDHAHKAITVVDYKTGKSYNRWQNDAKLYKYRRQLYAYKVLVEGAARFAGYSVTGGRLEFVEPDGVGGINVLELHFDHTELEHTKQLLQAIYSCVKQLDFPDTSKYSADLGGIKQFEEDLIADRL
jgi:DNA helicase-2/ATP-dependent DNA helicase PcrA